MTISSISNGESGSSVRTKLNSLISAANVGSSAVQHVLTAAAGGDDSADGLSWGTAKATIEAAIAALPTVSNAQNGLVRIGPGEFEPESSLLYSNNIEFRGTRQSQISLSTITGTIIKMPDSFNDHLFKRDTGVSDDWSHQVIFRDLTLYGNSANQSGGSVTPFYDGDDSTTLTFAESGSTITRSSGSWVTDGWSVGDKVRIHGSTSNNGTYTVAGVSATVLTVEEALTDEGPVNGIGAHSSPYDLIQMDKAGFGCAFQNVFFVDAPGWGLNIEEWAVNALLLNCTGASCKQGLLHFVVSSGSNLHQLSLSGTTQIDDCGYAPILVEDYSAGGSSYMNIDSMECEELTDGNLHDAIIRYKNVANSSTLRFNIGTISAYKANPTGQAVIHMVNSPQGGSFKVNIYGGIADTGDYTNVIQDDHGSISFAVGDAPNQWSNRPIAYKPGSGVSGSVGVGLAQILCGANNPESAVAASVGTIYLRSGGGASTTLYVKESGTGNTGWVAK